MGGTRDGVVNGWRGFDGESRRTPVEFFYLVAMGLMDDPTAAVSDMRCEEHCAVALFDGRLVENASVYLLLGSQRPQKVHALGVPRRSRTGVKTGKMHRRGDGRRFLVLQAILQ